MLQYPFQFLVSLIIRIGWHKYTDEKVYVINRYVIVLLIIIGLSFSGLSSIPYMLGFFLIDFLYYISKQIDKEIEVKNFIAALINMLPEKTEVENAEEIKTK
jgi:hypothetical protein